MQKATLWKSLTALGLPAAALLASIATVPVHAVEMPSPSPSPTTATPGESPVRLWAPRRAHAYVWRKRVSLTELGLELRAGDQPFEIWSTRTSYDEPVRHVWRSPDGDVALPSSRSAKIGQLGRFVTFEIEAADGTRRVVVSRACVYGQGQRLAPEAPASSPYPSLCYYSPFALGGVQGVQQGWSGGLTGMRTLRLPPGTYAVRASVSDAYADRLGMAAADRSRRFTLRVRRVARSDEGQYFGRARTDDSASLGRTDAPAAGARPVAARQGAVAGPTPDLRSLPAFDIAVARGNVLRFSATVWNGGDSPLVVDGFRASADEMDAYQYFFDTEGNQTGYQRVGEMHWDSKPTHQHWHFKDFARYSLVDAAKVETLRSRKEAFCLVNTDAVDLTVAGAEWRPDNTDLSSDCGVRDSRSLREVLAAGWGDTYTQVRAGQAFRLDGIPNGTYYIAVIANPTGRLVESSSDNNVAYRKVVIGGQPGARTVRVPDVGLVRLQRSVL